MAHGRLTCPKCNSHFDLTAVDVEVVVVQAEAPVEAEGELGAVLEQINVHRLDGKDREFVDDMNARFQKYGEKTFVSERQMKWLRALSGVPAF